MRNVMFSLMYSAPSIIQYAPFMPHWKMILLLSTKIKLWRTSPITQAFGIRATSITASRDCTPMVNGMITVTTNTSRAIHDTLPIDILVASIIRSYDKVPS